MKTFAKFAASTAASLVIAVAGTGGLVSAHGMGNDNNEHHMEHRDKDRHEDRDHRDRDNDCEMQWSWNWQRRDKDCDMRKFCDHHDNRDDNRGNW